MRSQKSKGPTVKVNFVILKSPHERHHHQSIIHRQFLPCWRAFSFHSRGVTEEIDKSTTTSEIVWRFSRYPDNSPGRAALKQNPHFYLELPNDAASYGSKFHKDPLKDFTYVYYHGLRTIYVLSDKSCRLYLDAAKPHEPRIFSNLWKPHKTIILKGKYSPRCVLCSNPCVFKILSAIWIQKTSYLATLGGAKTTGIASPRSLISLRNLATRMTTA